MFPEMLTQRKIIANMGRSNVYAHVTEVTVTFMKYQLMLYLQPGRISASLTGNYWFYIYVVVTLGITSR
jgi:hypothetical protein